MLPGATRYLVLKGLIPMDTMTSVPGIQSASTYMPLLLKSEWGRNDIWKAPFTLTKQRETSPPRHGGVFHNRPSNMHCTQYSKKYENIEKRQLLLFRLYYSLPFCSIQTPRRLCWGLLTAPRLQNNALDQFLPSQFTKCRDSWLRKLRVPR